jgi:hypothetical protein
MSWPIPFSSSCNEVHLCDRNLIYLSGEHAGRPAARTVSEIEIGGQVLKTAEAREEHPYDDDLT